MIGTAYQGTIDWNRYWEDADDVAADDANGSAEHLLDPLLEFVEATDVPDAHADVGCGGGALAFAVAERHPETDVVGYDAAEAVLRANRRRARADGRPDVDFERTVLPAFDPGRQFDLVTAFFTLCYVEDVERALRNLYDAVAPGGHLVLTYTNDRGGAHYGRVVDDPPTDDDGEPLVDVERYAERFSLVIDGESTLSYPEIQDALGTWPRSFWEVVDKPEEQWMWRNHPLVWVPK